MGWRFRKTFKVAPGIRVTLTDRGITTSLGPRGASVSVGKRGTHLNTSLPGTGLSARTRLSGGSRQSTSAPRRSGGTGLGWLLGGGFALVVVFAALASSGGSAPSSAVPLVSAGMTETAAPAPELDRLYVHGGLNVRSGPGGEFRVVRTLQRGESVLLGPKDQRGWAELFAFAGGEPEGYVYRASERVRASPPAVQVERLAAEPSTRSSGRSTSRPSRRSSSSGVYHLGPRGGCYTYTASGRKRYVDHSYCH